MPKKGKRLNNRGNQLTQSSENPHQVLEKSKLTEFAQKPIVVIIGLFIALMGGIPGIVTLFQFVRDKPQFDLAPFNIIIGEVQGLEVNNFPIDTTSPKTQIMVYVTCAITNSGNRPLFPNFFSADLIDGTERIELLAAPTPANVIRGLLPNGKRFSIDNAKEKDFQLIKKIEPNETIYGSLFFLIPPGVKLFKRSPDAFISLICLDLFGKQYTAEIPLLNTNPGVYTPLPKSGISINTDTF